jgi:arsenate reductase
MLHIQDLIEDISQSIPPKDRKQVLQPLIDYIVKSVASSGTPKLNFICTHNSRRSQFAQIWAHIAADHHGIKTEIYSGGVETTACNSRTIESLKRFGLVVQSFGGDNPKYEITFSVEAPPIICFSKLFNHASSPSKDFAAIMTCAHADENCPNIPGTDTKISVRYEDPKNHDNTRLEEIMYDKRALQIANEMFWIFREVKMSASR